MIFTYDCLIDTINCTARKANGSYVIFSIDNFLQFGIDDFSYINPDDKNKFKIAFSDAVKQQVSDSFDFYSNYMSDNYRICRLHYSSVADEEGNIYRIVGFASDIQDQEERKDLFNELQRSMPNIKSNIAIETSLTHQIFRTLYETTDTEKAINAILAALGKAFHVSRVYIFEDSTDHKYCSNTFEWCADGVAPEKDNLQNLSYEHDIGGNWHENFDETGIFYCHDICSLPKSQYDILKPQGIYSMLQCSLMDRQVFTGYMGFDECTGKRRWNKTQIETLHSASNIIGMFLLKHRETKALEEFLNKNSK